MRSLGLGEGHAVTLQQNKLVIIHTNDLHSHFENMPAVAATIDSLRRKYASDHVLVIDLGDHMERAAAITEGSDGLANVEVINATGYDLATLGNRELLTFSIDRLSQLMEKHATYSIICSNLQLLSTAAPPSWIKPYVIKEIDQVRIGIIGLTHYLPTFYAPLGWHILDPIQACQQWVDKIRADVDILIVMSHLGRSTDQRLVENATGIDLIIGSHSHHLLQQPLVHHGSCIVQAGCYGKHVGVVEINYLSNSGITGIDGACVSVDSTKRDRRTANVIEKYTNEAQGKLGSQIIHINESMDMSWHEESALGNLLAAGIRNCTNAEVGIINTGQFVDGLPAGKITREHLLRACPSPARPCRVRVLGQHILAALEEALLPEVVGRPIGGFGYSGKIVGTLCLDGMHVEFDSSHPPYQRIVKVWIQDRQLEHDREYTVGTIDAFVFGLVYKSLGAGSVPQFPYPGPVRHVLEEALRDQDDIQDSYRWRWQDLRSSDLPQ